jgi:hypothetical protein
VASGYTPTGGVVAIAEGVVTGEVTHRIVAVIDKMPFGSGLDYRFFFFKRPKLTINITKTTSIHGCDSGMT